MQLGLDLRSPNLSLIADCTMYLGAASFHIFDSEIDEECPEFPGHIDTQFLGYDCWAFIGHLNLDGSCVGAFILPFGPWTMDRAEIVDRLDKTPQGTAVNLLELLALFPQPMRVTETFRSSEGIIVASFDELELPAEADEAVTFDLNGDLTMVAFADDEDWIDGPVLILRSELAVSGNHSDLSTLDISSHKPGESGVTEEARAQLRGARKAQITTTHQPFLIDSHYSREFFPSPNGGLMGPVDFATLDDSSRIAEMTGLPLSDVTSAIEGDASAQNSVGYALLESSDFELGLAFLAASAHQGVPWALGSYTWFCIKTEQFERARDLFAVSAHACEMFVAVNSDDYESLEFLQTEWVNCRNNEALCALAMNEDPSWAVAVWAEGAETGHPESNFYPALVDWKRGDEQQAMEHLEGLDSEILDEMRQIMTDGSASAVGWFSLWCDEGIALLDRYESSHGSAPSAPTAINRFCTECGAERQVEHKFCGGCGAKFSGLDQAVANFVSGHDFANDSRSQRLGTDLCPHLGPWITDVTAGTTSAQEFAELASRIQSEPSDLEKASLAALHKADLPAGWAEVLTWAVKADPAGEFVLIAIGALYGLVEERLYGSDTSSPSDVKSLVYLVEGAAGFEYAYIEASNSQNYIPLGDADVWWPEYMGVVNTSLTHDDLQEISDTLGDACDTEMLSTLTPGDRLAELCGSYPHSSVVAANANLPSHIVNERMKDDWALLFHPNANRDRSWEIIQGILSDGSYDDLGYYMYEFSNLRDDSWFALSGFASTSPQAQWLKEQMKKWIEANIDDEDEQAEMFEMLVIAED